MGGFDFQLLPTNNITTFLCVDIKSANALFQLPLSDSSHTNNDNIPGHHRSGYLGAPPCIFCLVLRNMQTKWLSFAGTLLHVVLLGRNHFSGLQLDQSSPILAGTSQPICLATWDVSSIF